MTNRLPSIGFVNARVGVDGISMEMRNWAIAYHQLGYSVFLLTGKIEESGDKLLQESNMDSNYMLIYEPVWLFSEINLQINKMFWRDCPESDPELVQCRLLIRKTVNLIKEKLHQFISMKNIDVLVSFNHMSLPMHLPLAVALFEISEEGIPIISLGADWWWERSRYINFAKRIVVGNLTLQDLIPSKSKYVLHRPINTIAKAELMNRLGDLNGAIRIVTDTENFAQSPVKPAPDKITSLRNLLNIKPEDYVVGIPVRILDRKNIETAVYLSREVKQLLKQQNINHDLILLFTHSYTDENAQYKIKIDQLIQDSNLKSVFVFDKINEIEKKGFTAWDAYWLFDVAIYASTIEGFGNNWLEMIHHRIPVWVNEHPVFKKDIKPKGFDDRTFSTNSTPLNYEQARSIEGFIRSANEITSCLISKKQRINSSSISKDELYLKLARFVMYLESLQDRVKYRYGLSISFLIDPFIYLCLSITRRQSIENYLYILAARYYSLNKLQFLIHISLMEAVKRGKNYES